MDSLERLRVRRWKRCDPRVEAPQGLTLSWAKPCRSGLEAMEKRLLEVVERTQTSSGDSGSVHVLAMPSIGDQCLKSLSFTQPLFSQQSNGYNH